MKEEKINYKIVLLFSLRRLKMQNTLKMIEKRSKSKKKLEEGLGEALFTFLKS